MVALVRRQLSGDLPPAQTYNMGGPQRLSRVGMAGAVADALGLGHDNIVAAPSASVSRPFASPADISMDSSALQRDLGLTFRPMAQALAQMRGDA